VRVLTRVLSDHEPLDEALASVSGQITSAQARGWLTEVCSGTLRWKGRLDQAVDSTALKKKPSGWLRKILLVAAYQLIVQERTQPAAVVNETVNEVKRKEGEAPAKFANAALRKIADHAVQWRTLELRPKAPLAEAALWASMPDWIWQKLCKGRGLPWAQAYAAASLERPTTWIRSRDVGLNVDWAKAGPVPGSFELTEGGAVTEKPGFGAGDFFVQDISSQRLVAAISEKALKSGPRALDLCAAPGGKSVGLAWSGMKVHSSDRDAARYALLQNTIERTAPGLIQVVAREKIGELEPLDLVWVDAPCTGTGILRRHPDVRWLRREKELDGLLQVQQELLAEAWGRVKPGGYLAYSVCSVLVEEGPDALARFLSAPVARDHAVKTDEWFFAPQEPPHGDGFWAALVYKKP
jgi:16S rRNA (cytosine967-C5)-methyltransferase